jgi:hypothetical protein
MKTSIILNWVARLLAALIMVQTLYFKFSGAEESIYIFTTVGMEPWGRIGIGVLELIASVLLLVNSVAWLGAGLALGLMLGAIGMHLTILGIEVRGDGGYLFILSVIVSVCSAFVLFMNRKKVLDLLLSLRPK